MCCGPWGHRESHATWRLNNNRNRREPSLSDAQHPAQRERAVIYRWLPSSWSWSRHGNCGMWAAMPLPSIISNEHLHVEITHGIIKGYTNFQSHLWSSTPTPNSQQEVNVCAQFNSLKAYVFPEYWIQTQSRHWWAKDLLSPLFPLTFKIWLNCVLKILTDGTATLEKLGWFFQMLKSYHMTEQFSSQVQTQEKTKVHIQIKFAHDCSRQCSSEQLNKSKHNSNVHQLMNGQI